MRLIRLRPLVHHLVILLALIFCPPSLADEFRKSGDTEIRLTSPESGETWREGSVHYIKWEATSDIGRVILFAASGGKEKGYLEGTGNGISAERGFFRWQIPNRFITGMQNRASNEVRLMIKLDEGGDAETLAKGLEGVEVLGDRRF